MLVCDYIVERIDGDYAHLRRTDEPEEELKMVARALLPTGQKIAEYDAALRWREILNSHCTVICNSESETVTVLSLG